MSALIDQLKETTDFIRSQYPHTPIVGIVLGSGLGSFTNEIAIEKEIPYGDIPHFPVSTVEGHSGKLIFGELGGKKVVAMAGRFHYYEGYSAQQVVYPIRTMKMLGCSTVLLTNAAGSVHPKWKVGDLMIIKDHISFFMPNPLIGKNEKALGTRFPDMSEPYSMALIDKVKAIATKLNYEVQEGVYCAVTGPTFETRAEYQLIKTIGADVVGMSTVPEVIAAVHCGLQVFGMSVVTDIGIREDENVITHEEVLEAAKNAEPKLTAIFNHLIAAL
jgi:purine-nucleoside phosphorylase